MIVQKTVKTGFLDNFFVFIKRFVYNFLFNHYGLDHHHYKIINNHYKKSHNHYGISHNHYEIDINHYFIHFDGKKGIQFAPK